MLNQTIQKVDSIISSLEKELGVPPSNVDPDDPWARKNVFRSSVISKSRCANCNYLLTAPFERNCPSCYFKDKSKIPDQLGLLPAEEILKRIKAVVKEDTGAANKQQAQQKSKGKAQAAPVDVNAEFPKAQIQVSKVISIKRHPEADKLYVADIDIGGGNKRQLCAGLVGHYQPEDLEGRLVVTILNLKPRKLKGVESAAMILAADNADKVRVLDPPANSEVGDRVYTQGFKPSEPAKEFNANAWTEIVTLLKVQSNKATFQNQVLITDKGEVSVPDLPDGSGIH